MSDNQFLKSVKMASSDAKDKDPLFKLWQKIEKHQKRNANLKTKIKKLYEQFSLEVTPVEQKQSLAIAEQIRVLTPFVSRKTLSGYEREELINWLHQDLDYLSQNPFSADIDIRLLEINLDKEIGVINNHKINKLTAEDLDDLRQTISFNVSPDLELSDDDLRAIAADPEKLMDFLEKLDTQSENDNDEFFDDNDELFDDEDEFESSFFNDFYNQQQEYFTQENEKNNQHQATLERLFKGSQLSKMYKRLAAKLHPDKEQDPDKKQFKHQLMQQLSQARKDKDGFTIVQIYLQNFDDDVVFDSVTLDNLLPLLRAKVAELNEEYTDIKEQEDIQTVVWHKFNGRSKAIIAKNIQQHIQVLEDECTQISADIASYRTVKDIKHTLRLRRQKYEMEMFESMAFDSTPF